MLFRTINGSKFLNLKKIQIHPVAWERNTYSFQNLYCDMSFIFMTHYED